MATGLMGGTNTFVPTFEQEDFQVNFSRNPNRFAINQYAQVRPRDKTAGKYLLLSTEEQMRIVTQQDFVWPDGQDRPTGELREFEFLDWTTTRYSESANISYRTSRVASFDVVKANLQMHASRRMLARTMGALTQLTTTSNYTTGTNYFAEADDTAVAAGWDATEGNVQWGVQLAQQYINQVTAGTVMPEDIVMVTNPFTAAKIGRLAEIRNYVKNYPFAKDYLYNGFSNASMFGLPPMLFGSKVVVENAVRVSTRKKSDKTATRGWALADNAVIFVSRPGGLVSESEGPNFSTLAIYVYQDEDFKVSVFDEPKHERNVATLTDCWGAKLVAPVTAYYIADVFN